MLTPLFTQRLARTAQQPSSEATVERVGHLGDRTR
jgi:hypothetical protein